VAVQLGIKHQHVQLIILDDGCGFDPSQPHYGMGLQNMRERAAGLKGSFDLASQPSKGTRVSVTIPLDNLLEVESQQGGLDE
jgi:signal transduction histidine kinase